VQSALNALSCSKFFAGIADRLLIGNLKQVSKYFREDGVRSTAGERVADWIAPDTKVLIGHSLGSIVAYEALCAHPDWPVRTLITLGSPLGIRNLIFDRLRPAPINGKGAWPRRLVRWVNVSDGGDIVALTKALGPMFDGTIEDYLVHNDANAHDVKPYLTAVETGQAIAAGLAD
jgi:pimeloyl-ACP methyl ester carboxylesterase